MTMSPLQRRAERRERHRAEVDLPLVSLIDIFVILIFFLLSHFAAVELLPSSKAVRLPESNAERAPRDTVVVVVSDKDIIVQGRKVASVAEALAQEGDEIAPLKAALDRLGSVQTIRQDNAAQAKTVTIMGDRHIEYRLLRKIMVTCARANFTEVALAVQQKGDA
ncbi:MAG: biopolymer transporter ExbD [Sutterellaceae bacterium]|nr:biopolymer transporter ExbD [Burkholderiaceae bacterium]MCX7901158.1 biopolymer transporter ExbD [Burkholderiaceae bacterium]MDW8428950.1 biopolymer transporter ExbD [Sutterellaceae bacterium]